MNIALVASLLRQLADAIEAPEESATKPSVKKIRPRPRPVPTEVDIQKARKSLRRIGVL